MLCTIGARASEEAAGLFAEDKYQRLPLPARPQRRDGRGHRGVLAPAHPRRARLRRRGRAHPGRPLPPAVSRRSLLVGLPGLPDLSDNAKVVELLGGDRIGVTVSEGFQLHPEQTTDAIVCSHPRGQVLRGLSRGSRSSRTPTPVRVNGRADVMHLVTLNRNVQPHHVCICSRKRARFLREPRPVCGDAPNPGRASRVPAQRD